MSPRASAMAPRRVCQRAASLPRRDLSSSVDELADEARGLVGAARRDQRVRQLFATATSSGSSATSCSRYGSAARGCEVARQQGRDLAQQLGPRAVRPWPSRAAVQHADQPLVVLGLARDRLQRLQGRPVGAVGVQRPQQRALDLVASAPLLRRMPAVRKWISRPVRRRVGVRRRPLEHLGRLVPPLGPLVNPRQRQQRADVRRARPAGPSPAPRRRCRSSRALLPDSAMATRSASSVGLRPAAPSVSACLPSTSTRSYQRSLARRMRSSSRKAMPLPGSSSRNWCRNPTA